MFTPRAPDSARPRVSKAGRRLQAVAVAAASVTVVAGLALVVANVSRIDPSQAGFLWDTPSPQPGSGASGAGATAEAPEPATPPPTARPLTAVFIGDSYSFGMGASAPALRWTTLVADHEGWIELNAARSGTGYLKASGGTLCGNEHCPNYLQVVPHVIRAEPGVVVVAGGQNDLGAFPARRAATIAAITRTFADLRRGLPGARIIAVGPSTPWAITPDLIALDAAVRDAAAMVGAEYLSLIKPNVLVPAMISPDGVHVSDAGHAAIAARVIAAL